MSAHELAAHEPSDAVAFGVFDGEELIAVGLVGPEGEPGDWRIRGMAAKPEARGRGAGTKVLEALVDHKRGQRRGASLVQRPHARAVPV